jgi:hypothetical protein
MKKINVLLLMLLPCFGFAQSTTTTTTTTTENNPAPSTEKSNGDNTNNNDHNCCGGFIGARFMPTFTFLDIHQQNNGNVKGTAVLGYGVGAFIGYNFSKNVGIQGEVLYSSLSQKFVEGEKKQRLDLSYINIPVMLSLNTNYCAPVNLNFVVGPQLGINTGSKVKTEGNEGTDTVQAVVAVKPTDLGIAYGAGVDFRLGTNLRLGIGFRGVYGLVDISDDSNNTTTDQYYVIDRAKVKTYSAYVGLGIDF